MQKYKVHIIWAVIAIIALVGGIFYGKSGASGSATSKSVASSTRSGYAGRGMAGGIVSGQIVSVDSGSMTVSLTNGNSDVVFYSSSTQIMKPTIVPATSLAAGANVMIVGTSNSDGSYTAQSIQVRGTGDFPGGGTPGSGPSGNGGTP